MNKKPTDPCPPVEPRAVHQPIVQPIIDQMKKPHTPPPPTEQAPPVGPVHPPKSAELDQDPGGGYNANHVIPQP
jgi:hypothetical protein